MIPPDPKLVDDPDEVLDRIDGLILAGGADIDPASYGSAPIRKPGTVTERDRPRSPWRAEQWSGTCRCWESAAGCS